MNIKITKESLTALIMKLNRFFVRYAVFLFVLLTLGLFGFLVYRIGTLAKAQPSDSLVETKMGETRPINIDRSAVEKIQQLQSTNIEVKALFDQNRDNPFQE